MDIHTELVSMSIHDLIEFYEHEIPYPDGRNEKGSFLVANLYTKMWVLMGELLLLWKPWFRVRYCPFSDSCLLKLGDIDSSGHNERRQGVLVATHRFIGSH